MRVLVANIPLPRNRFLVDLNAALAQKVDLHHSHEDFWNQTGEADVVHLHFPEYLTFEIQDAYMKGLDDALIEAIEERLEYWAERAAIVITRHVLLPHDAITDPRWERLYETIYRYCDGVAHFASASEEEFGTRYKDTDFNRKPVHGIVPHQNYDSLPNTITRDEARKRLGIADDRNVVLVFGSIRSQAEAQLILSAFDGCTAPKKHLLVSKWREEKANVSWIRLRNWIRDAKRAYYRLHPNYHFNYDFVDEEDAQVYMNAADVLLIPRFRVLNSGNVTMGMTFGRVVVGPDSWDVGELLRETGNPVFDPDRVESAGGALDEAFEKVADGSVPASNRRRALAEWTPTQCADMYMDLYDRALQSRAAQGARTYD